MTIVEDQVRSNKKLDYEYVKNYFHEYGCSLEEKEYVNSKTQMKYICVCGRESYIKWNNFKKGQRCKQCAIEKNAKNQTNSIEFVRSFFARHGCELTSDDYKSIKSIMKYRCNCGKVTSKSFAAFKVTPHCTCELTEKISVRKTYSKQELIEYFWEYFDKNRVYLELKDFSAIHSPSKQDYLRIFGSWDNFLIEIKVKGRFGLYLADEQYLLKYFNKHDKNTIMNDLIKKRTWDNICRKAELLGVKEKQLKYTDDELIAMLQAYYKTYSTLPKQKDFTENGYPDARVYTRRFGSWHNALKKANIKCKEIKHLSNEDEDIIINMYQKGFSAKEIASKFFIYESRVFSILRNNNVETNSIQWTKVELDMLKSLYPTEEWDVILTALPNRRKDQIVHKASTLNIKREFHRYTNEELEIIYENYDKLPTKEIAKLLPNRSECSIACKANKLGLISREKWDDDEIQKLIELYPVYTNEELLEHFSGRTLSSLSSMATMKLGLSKDTNHLQQKRNLLIKEQLIQDLKLFATTLNRTPTTNEISENEDMAGAITYHRYFGSYSNACILAGLEVNSSLFGISTHCTSKNGDICLSKAEQIITNLLIDNGISYQKEVLYKEIIEDYNEKNIRCDWLIDDIVIEYFGLMDKQSYNERACYKINLCETHGIKILSLYPEDVRKNLKGVINKFKEIGYNISCTSYDSLNQVEVML